MHWKVDSALPALMVLHISKGDKDLAEVRAVYEQRFRCRVKL